MIVQKEVASEGEYPFGSPDHISVDRALAEFRSGRPIVVASSRETLVTMPVDGIDAQRWSAYLELCAPALPFLVITRQRARALHMTTGELAALKLAPTVSASRILSLAADAEIDDRDASALHEATPLGSAAAAAIELAKLAQLLPAVLAAPAPADWSSNAAIPVVSVQAKAIAAFRRGLACSLKLTAQADVPVQEGLAARFIVFTDMLGRSQTAVIVGQPDFSKPVPVRLHSACLTGDVFGSRRCDCGDQLRLSLRRLQHAGGGVVLYLAQEGRGLGLANKMRAYRLQDAGLDTVDANTTLGFEHDERDYLIAARMLKMLGCSRVLLLSNNPAKIEGLGDAGIEVAGHIPLVTPVTSDNRRYLATKAARAGHRLGELTQDVASDGGTEFTVRP
jgi:GTP cyclohydrolase II